MTTLREFDDAAQRLSSALVSLRQTHKEVDPSLYEAATHVLDAHNGFNEARELFQFSEATYRLHDMRQTVAKALSSPDEVTADEVLEVLRETDAVMAFVEEEIRRYGFDKAWLIRSLHGGDGDYGTCSCSYHDW